VDVLRTDQPAPEYLPFSFLVQKAAILLRIMSAADRLWGWVGGVFLLGGVLAGLMAPALWRWLRAPSGWPLLAVAGGCYLLFATRVALLAYLDTVAIPSVNLLYLSPAMPMLLLASALGWFLALRSLWHGRRVLARRPS
jgi:hypothetical protein